MTTSIGTIAQQALRLLGVRVVPLDDSPTINEMVPAADIATAALVDLGILNSAGTPTTGTVSTTEIATGALVELGVLNSDETLAAPTTVAEADIVTAAYVELGVLNSDLPDATDTVSQATIATTALVELGVIAADETPSISDQALVVDKVASVHGALQAQGIATWALTAIPRAFAEEYAKLTASMAASSFGKVVDPAIVAMLEGRIRLGATVLNNDDAFMTRHLEAVHEGLVAKGIALWNIYAIPSAFYSEYVKLTAAMAATSFGKQADPAVIAMLEDRVRAGAMVLNNNEAFMLNLVSDVHASLVGQGIAGWPIGGIPRAFAEEYIKLTVGYAAASFGKPVDPAVIAMLEGRVRNGAAVFHATQAFMLDKVASVHAALDAQGVVWWTGDAVPRAFAEEYVKLTAAYAAPALGKQIDLAIVPVLEARVRKGAMVISSDDNAQQAVQAVHDDLVMRGIARWSSFDIPDAVGTSYVTLAADALSPLFGVRTDPNAARDAMQAIYRYVALPTSGEMVHANYF